MIYKTTKFSVIFTLALAITFSNLLTVLNFTQVNTVPDAFAGDTKVDVLVYRGSGDTSIPEYKTHNSGGFGAEGVASDVDSGITFLNLAASPDGTSDDKILCITDSANDVNCQVWGGSSWGNLAELSAASSNEAQDVACEHSSNTCFVMYRDSVDTSVPYGNIWNGTNWTTTMNAAGVGGILRTIRLFPDPDSDYVAMLTGDQGNDLNVQIWDGSDWGNLLELEDAKAGNNLSWDFAGGWETNSDDFVVVWFDGSSGVDEFQAREFDKTTGWGSEIKGVIGSTAFAGTSNALVEAASDPTTGSDDIVFIMSADNDVLYSKTWTGSGFNATTTLSSSFGTIGTISGDHHFDIEFEHGGDNDAIVTYGETNSALKYRVWDSATDTWGGETSLPTSTENATFMRLSSDPKSTNVMLTILGIGGGNSQVETLEWTGSGWDANFTNHETGSHDGFFVINYVYDYEDENLPALDQVHYRWKANHQTETGTTYLAAEDTHLTGQKTASTTRLRMILDETLSTATTTIYQLEYATSTISGFTACSALSTWVPVPDSASSTSYAWKMSPTAKIADGGATTDNAGLTNPTGTFGAGETRDINNRTSAITISAGNFTELEWAIEANSGANGESYCFRTTNADDTTNFTYTKYPRISLATSTSLDQLHYRWRADNATSSEATWWDTSFLNRRKVTFNNIPSDESLTDFPMYVPLSSDTNDTFGANINYTKTQNHGEDIRFVDANNTTMLKHEVENWNESGTSTAWVKIPQLNKGSETDFIWMYYNNTSTTTGAATSSVWDANFKGVWHFQATSTAARKFYDATNVTTGIGTGFESDEYTASGHNNGALDLEGIDDYVAVGNVGSGMKTISFWMKADVAASKKIIDIDGTDQIETNASSQITATSFPASTVYVDGVVASTIDTSWHYVAVTDTTGVNASGFDIGRVSTGYFNGTIDEVRISNVIRSADWVQAEYRFTAASSTTHTFGPEESEPGASFLAAEDTHLTGQSTASTTRLRILVDETIGYNSATTTIYQLEYATSTVAGFSACSALTTWVSVANSASSTSFAWKMSPTSNVTDGGPTDNVSGLTDPTSGFFIAGETKDINNRTSAISLTAGDFTELEWAIEATSEANGDSYCFRATNADDTTDFTFTVYPRISMSTSTVTYTQNTFLFYANTDAVQPSDAWPAGGPNVSENEALTGIYLITNNDIFRLRINITVGGATLSASTQDFKLQYAEADTCSSGTYSDLGALNAVDEKFRFYDNGFGDAQTISATLLSDSNIKGSYVEINPSATNPLEATATQNIEYDWSVQAYKTANSTQYCFRIIKSNDDDFTVDSGAYTRYPQVKTITRSSPGATGGGGPAGASTQTGGTQKSGSESGDAPPSGGTPQTGGGSSGGGEVRLPLSNFMASLFEALGKIVYTFLVKVISI